MELLKINLQNVALVCIDSVDSMRGVKAIYKCQEHINFGMAMIYGQNFIELQRGSGNAMWTVDPIKSIEEYSRYVFKEMIRHIHTDYCMIIQHDGFVLNPYLWQDAFLDYDYIGAPWWYDDGKNVGNGGFSIRSRRLMLELQDPFYTDVHPEDEKICRKYRPRLESKGFTFAPEWLAKQFSWEGNPKYPEFKNNTFGYHCNGFKLP